MTEATPRGAGDASPRSKESSTGSASSSSSNKKESGHVHASSLGNTGATNKESSKEKEHRSKKRAAKDKEAQSSAMSRSNTGTTKRGADALDSTPSASSAASTATSSSSSSSSSITRVDGDGWAALPLKAVRVALSFLGEKDLCRLAQVSRNWSSVSSEDSVWKDLYQERYPEEKHRKRIAPYKELFRVRVERAKDPLSIRAPPIEVSAAPQRPSPSSRRRNTTNVTSTSTGTSKRGKKTKDGVLPLVLTDAYAAWSRELLGWLAEQVEEFNIVVDSLSSLSSGHALLALAHKIEPSAVDYEAFDKRSTDRALSTALTVIEDSLAVPALLDARDIQSNADPRASLLWLAAVRAAVDELDRDVVHSAHTEVAQALSLLDESYLRASSLEDAFSEASLQLGAVLAMQEGAEEKVFLDARALLQERALAEALATVRALDERNTLLQEENRILEEKLTLVERDLRLEEVTRRRVEEQLEIEERIKAMGEELNDRGALNYLKLFEKKDDADAAALAAEKEKK